MDSLRSSHPAPNHFRFHGGHKGTTGSREQVTKNTILHRVVPVVGALALGGGIGAGVYAGLSGGSSGSTTTTTAAPATSTVQPASATTSSLTQIYKEATPGVVDITVTEAASSNG